MDAMPSCTWSRRSAPLLNECQHSYASTAASFSHAEPEVNDETAVPGSDEHPAFAMLSGDEHPSAYALSDDETALEADLISCAIDVLQRALRNAAGDADESNWRGILDFELLPLCDQSTSVSNAVAAIIPSDWFESDWTAFQLVNIVGPELGGIWSDPSI
eukprot:Skav236793  [mRNA]  locus=scaffold1361:439598:449271:- [translate_table: standard]